MDLSNVPWVVDLAVGVPFLPSFLRHTVVTLQICLTFKICEEMFPPTSTYSVPLQFYWISFQLAGLIKLCTKPSLSLCIHDNYDIYGSKHLVFVYTFLFWLWNVHEGFNYDTLSVDPVHQLHTESDLCAVMCSWASNGCRCSGRAGVMLIALR